ncbi:nuclear transport factor 2 family protein [Paractinoplanes toevensis]|uniref:SnoaL-like domain-containing protein n=1 Tax=Paractinoplanes toevensis TaxID=571911 RepID=A0A919W1Y6_9ACTN|nr:nuclear transport factor 2 family protein [Actinoplanes toevensis]GIM92987.1 hypothetical protein Ato02nite_047800 [Actinoplanes toevensis]
MTDNASIRYLLDRIAIQDVIATYGLGQDLHQGQDEDQTLMTQWSQVFSPDAVIDASEVGQSAAITLADYVDFMRGRDRKGTEGLGKLFSRWQHREGHAVVTLYGDRATAVSPFLHLHETRDGQANVIHTGLWHDQLRRRPEGWRIVHRRLSNGFFNTLARIEDPSGLLER